VIGRSSSSSGSGSGCLNHSAAGAVAPVKGQTYVPYVLQPLLCVDDRIGLRDVVVELFDPLQVASAAPEQQLTRERPLIPPPLDRLPFSCCLHEAFAVHQRSELLVHLELVDQT
jgi:hypothetical protein